MIVTSSSKSDWLLSVLTIYKKDREYDLIGWKQVHFSYNTSENYKLQNYKLRADKISSVLTFFDAFHVNY